MAMSAADALSKDVPSHWPAGISVDVGPRIKWLPLDWGQGLKMTAGGRPYTSFVSPSGVIRYHKKDIEKELGELPDVDTGGNVLDGVGRVIRAREAPVLTRPAHWPENVRVDPANKTVWVPEGWGQGFKTTASGKDLKCYINRDGRLFYHKQDIEKFLGYELSSPGDRRSMSQRDRLKGEMMQERVPTPVVEMSGGYKLKPWRQSDDNASIDAVEGIWVVVPDDVISLDLERLGPLIVESGWTLITQDPEHWTFSGLPDLILCCNGELLVDSQDRGEAIRLGNLFVERWLGVE